MLNQRNSVRTGALLAAFCLLLSGIRSAHAQAVYGSLYGTVRDTSGAVIKGATVTVTDEQKGTVQTRRRTIAGTGSVEHLIPDSYDVKVDASSFQSTESKGVVVHATPRS